MDIITLAAAKQYTNDSINKIIESGGAGTIVDPTLSVSGAAADAKVTGDRLGAIVTEIPASVNIYPAFSADKWIDNEINGGFVTSDENYCWSKFITVKPNTKYSITHKPHNVVDNNGIEISISGDIDMETGGLTFSIYTPTNCSQISITIDKREYSGTTDINTAVENFNSVFMLVEGNTLPTEFVPYIKGGYRLNDNVSFSENSITEIANAVINTLQTAEGGTY